MLILYPPSHPLPPAASWSQICKLKPQIRVFHPPPLDVTAARRSSPTFAFHLSDNNF
ncbi:hypothetical protein F2Q68_00000611 [Brassica cretica]|uniref:Uncharacterized protein n=1 Tax=Brassica cretica TaxID=69181 RepID=A0A8S9JJN0_BRACR|nr:hypothetical protein F2Q68_00000611 [Brassica cretica]